MYFIFQKYFFNYYIHITVFIVRVIITLKTCCTWSTIIFEKNTLPNKVTMEVARLFKIFGVSLGKLKTHNEWLLDNWHSNMLKSWYFQLWNYMPNFIMTTSMSFFIITRKAISSSVIDYELNNGPWKLFDTADECLLSRFSTDFYRNKINIFSSVMEVCKNWTVAQVMVRVHIVQFFHISIAKGKSILWFIIQFIKFFKQQINNLKTI